MRVQDIAWAAGFIEGEGSFAANPKTSSMVITVAQVQKEPVLRLQKLFGGSLRYYSATTPQRRTSYGKRGIWFWRRCGKSAVGVCMTIFSLMSPKRKKKIMKIIKEWTA